MTDYLLTFIIFIPLAGMVAICFLPGNRLLLIRWSAALFTLPSLLLSAWLVLAFDRNNPGVQFAERAPWIPSWNIEYFVGVDGLSITMVFLTALLSFLCIFASWGIERGAKGYFSLFLMLEVGMLGVFAALDFFLFYVFWEIALMPMYFLIGVWGGPRREYAAIKFFLFTLAGSVLMLLAMIALYFSSDPPTFDIIKLIANNSLYSTTPLSAWPFNVWPLSELRWGFQHLVWIALFIGFAIKIPAFPFHTWLPDAHVEAPTPISVILAGVLLKMGTYGILRINYPMLPAATADMAYIFLAALGTWNIIYGAFCAMAQTDMKKMVAYSSISHMGYVMLGMATFTSRGIDGAVLQMFNHGTITAMMFLLVGVIYDRAHHRDIDGFGGLANLMPVYSGISALGFFAAMGLPGLSSFISEVLVLLGAWQIYPELAIVGALVIVLTAGYMLWMIQRMYLGAINEKYVGIAEISGRELFTLVPLGIIVIAIGVYPQPVLELLSNTLNQINGIILPYR
jgi:NADH-quinone oxidoreductase subunit M